MNITLTPDLDAIVRRRLLTGRYSSASEVVREALQLLDERDRLGELRSFELKQDLAAVVADLDRGASAPLDVASIKAAGRKLLRDRTRR